MKNRKRRYNWRASFGFPWLFWYFATKSTIMQHVIFFMITIKRRTPFQGQKTTPSWQVVHSTIDKYIDGGSDTLTVHTYALHLFSRPGDAEYQAFHAGMHTNEHLLAYAPDTGSLRAETVTSSFMTRSKDDSRCLTIWISGWLVWISYHVSRRARHRDTQKRY